MKNPALLLAVALAWAGLMGPARGDQAASGREVYELRCRTCHGGAKADSPIGPSLVGIIGTRAGSQPTGIHSRALIDSGTVWDRDSLRRYLADPRHVIPGTTMPVQVQDPSELESLLDFLETLR